MGWRARERAIQDFDQAPRRRSMAQLMKQRCCGTIDRSDREARATDDPRHSWIRPQHQPGYGGPNAGLGKTRGGVYRRANDRATG